MPLWLQDRKEREKIKKIQFLKISNNKNFKYVNSKGHAYDNWYIWNSKPRYRKMAEEDRNKTTGRDPTESMSLRDSKDYQEASKHLKDCYSSISVPSSV